MTPRGTVVARPPSVQLDVRRGPFPDAAGFTLIELQVVLALVVIIGAMTAFTAGNALVAARGDAAASQVASIMRAARDFAIFQGRIIEVEFVQPNRIRLHRHDLPNGTTVIGDVTLANQAQFAIDDALPDTPDGYGRAAAIDFDDAMPVEFLPDSSLTDSAGVPVNGTVFIAIPGQLNSARAVTVTGASARAQVYRWNGSHWEAR
jgi:Tfp pilus assembly protein FimT